MKKLLAVAVFVLALMGPRAAHADFYTGITSSVTMNGINVSSFTPTQMDVVPLSGRTQIEIQNLDSVATNYMLCAVGSSAATVTISTSAARYIPGGTTGTAGTVWSLGLSNFASNYGAYPTSLPFDVFCETTRVGGLVGGPNAIVVQSK